MTDFTNDAGTGIVDGDGFRGAPIPGKNPNLPQNQTHKPASFPAGMANPPSFVAAAGATQGNATKILGAGFYIASASASTEGLELPAAATGVGCWVWMTAAHGAKVYPAPHQFIDAGASNVAEAQAAGKAVLYYAKDAAHWVTFKSS